MKNFLKDIAGAMFVAVCIAGPVALHWFGPLGN